MEENIFHFNDRAALAVQCSSACKSLYNNFFHIVDGNTYLPKLERNPFASIKEKYECIEWMPDYGCAILFGRLNSRESLIVVVGLDNWKDYVHESVIKREPTALPDVTKPFVLTLGQVPTSDIEDIKNEFSKLMSKKQSGLQKKHCTPSFIAGVLLQVLQKEVKQLATMGEKASSPSVYGGTTDVGPHTGCLPRNTSFPLVLSTIKVMLESVGVSPDDAYFEKCICIYYLHYLIGIVAGMKWYVPRVVDRAIIVIREIEKWTLVIHDEEWKGRVAKLIEEQHTILSGLQVTFKGVVKNLPAASVSDTIERLQSPKFPKIPSQNIDMKDSDDEIQHAKDEAKKNLCWSNVSSPSKNGPMQDKWLLLEQLGSRFWSMALDLENRKVSQNVGNLRGTLGQYRSAISKAQKVARKSTHIMSVVLRSHELLATWICCCWAHRIALEQFPIFEMFDAALDPEDLEHLVIYDIRARQAMDAVQNFLNKHRKDNPVPFRNRVDTLALALKVAESLPDLIHLYDSETKAANHRIDERYQRILEAQKDLENLDAELIAAEEKLQEAITAKRKSKKRDYDQYSGHIVRHSRYHTFVAEEQQCELVRDSIKTQIATIEAGPSEKVMKFPLPEERNRALQWLFFIFMPKEFVDLLVLIHLGQSLLWKEVPLVQSIPTDLVAWYDDRNKFGGKLSTLEQMTLGCAMPVPKVDIPRTLRGYGKRSGVFFPDILEPKPSWTQSDPFSSVNPHEDKVLLFTEVLPKKEGHEVLQKFLPMLPDPSRGNLGICLRDQKPNWLSHEEFLMYASLRAFPNTQTRQLIVALSEQLLPFQEHSVNVLIRQALYHTGDNKWNADVSQEDGLKGLAVAIEKQAELLRASPSNASKILLFGDMCSFFAQYKEPFSYLAGEFSKIAEEFAVDVGKNEIVHKGHASSELYWKQGKLYGYSLLCFSAGLLSTEKLLKLLELLVLYRNKKNLRLGQKQPKMEEALNRTTSKVLKCLKRRYNK